LSFLIALFTVEEDQLLNLLTENQFENLKIEFPDNFFDEYERKKTGNTEDTIAAAVDRVTARAFDSYQLFRLAFTRSGGDFVYPVRDTSSDD
jgi:hypothetical protein